MRVNEPGSTPNRGSACSAAARSAAGIAATPDATVVTADSTRSPDAWGDRPAWLQSERATALLDALARELLPGLAAPLERLAGDYVRLSAQLRGEGLPRELPEGLAEREDDAALDGYLLGVLAWGVGTDLLRHRRASQGLRHLAARARELWGEGAAPPPEELPLVTPAGGFAAVLVPAFAFHAAGKTASTQPPTILRAPKQDGRLLCTPSRDPKATGSPRSTAEPCQALPHPPGVREVAGGLRLPLSWYANPEG